MSLPCKKIYVDSQYKLPESLTSSSFKIELPFSITMPHNACFTVDEICIPHAWYSIEKDINDKLYLYEMDMTSRERASIIVQIPPGNYNGDLLKSTLQSLITPAVAFSSFNVNYDPTTFSITFQIITLACASIDYHVSKLRGDRDRFNYRLFASRSDCCESS